MTTFEMPTVLVNPANMQRYIRDKGKSFLGSGSFGLCYRFREIARGREVAVKVSKKNTPKEHKKMRQEADINRLFRHENVIQMFDYFMDKGQMYIVLEYCSNNSLKELLNRRTTITESECRYYIRQIVAGVEHIHSQKYVHRDLKLENVFLNEQLRAKIGDFGMSAKIRNDLPRKSFCGTPNYMAPEIVEEEAYYFEVDIWSIGCMLYALLYGKPPFAPRPNEHGLRGTYDRIQRVQYDLPADTPPATRALISALLQRVPSNRPNADQVLKFEFFNQPTPKWLPQTALCVEPDLSAMDFYETIKLQRLQHKQPNVPVRRPLAAISNHQPNGRQPQKQAAEDRAGKKTENGGKRLVEQMQMAMGELRIETNNTVRVVPSSTRRKTTLSQRRCNFEDHARILAVQLNGLVAKLRTAHNLPVEEMYRSRMQSPSCAPPIWITRWIARSDEFFAYSLSDKSHGAGFSDGSFMQLDKDLQRMTYIDQQLTEWPFLVAEDGDVPEALKPRVHQMWDVVDQLHGLNVLGIDKGNRQTAEEVDFLTREPVVRVWDIQAELAAMWLSNGLLQVNWRQGEERLKLFVCPLMQCVSFLDANQRFTTIKFDTLLTYGCAMKFRNYIEKLPDIVARLRQKHVDNQTRNAAGKRCTETGCRGLKRNDCNDGVAQPNAVFPLEKMPSDSGKASEKELEARNLQAIQRIDPCAKTIMDKAVHVALYRFRAETKSWEKTECAGSMFIYERVDKPFYSLMIVNRQSLSDFILPIETNIQISKDASNKQIMFVKKMDGTINSFWFHKEDECLRISFTVEKICQALKKGIVPQLAKKQASEDKSQQILGLLRSSEKTATAASKPVQSQQPVKKPETASLSESNSFERSNLSANETYPEMLQKLLLQERNVVNKEPPLNTTGVASQVPLPPSSMLNADELEKDLMRTAKPRNYQFQARYQIIYDCIQIEFQEFINSPSAASLNALSTRSVHGSEGGDRDLTELDPADTSLLPPTVFQLGPSGLTSGQSTPLLSKEQLAAALVHMLQNDDDFITNLHQAYADAVNSRLK